MNMSSRNLRQQALSRIAHLAVATSPEQSRGDRLEKLYNGLSPKPRSPQRSRHIFNGLPNGTTNGSSLAKAPVTLEELHVLLALCKAAPQIENPESAENLLQRLQPYLAEAPEQAIAPSPFSQSIDPSPWEALSLEVVNGLLAVGLKHNIFHGPVFQSIEAYLEKCAALTEGILRKEATNSSWISTTEGISEVMILSLSLLGFIRAAAEKFYFFSIRERLDIVQQLRELLSDRLLTSVEEALSSIRNAESPFRILKDLKFFSHRYAREGRPLGAMLLQEAFIKLVKACSSLEIADHHDLQQSSVIDLLMSKRHPQLSPNRQIHVSMIEMLSEIAADVLYLLDEGADYLSIGSPQQQRLASKARGHALTTFLVCMVVDEDIADVDVLMNWLENSLADSVQMTDEGLACTVLKSLAIVAKTSETLASVLGRSLPRFIVRGGIQGTTVVVAAQCLTSILQLLSQDAVITGIYSLGNVLSAGNVDKGLASAMYADSSLARKTSNRYTQHTTASAISLGVSSEEETSAVYVNVVRAIVTITTTCADDKITSLALSMLLQKLARVNLAVDLAIITETARLGIIGSTTDLKSLLKLYNRLGHEALNKSNEALLGAIMQARVLIAREVPRDSTLYQAYLLHVMETIVSKGDIPEGENNQKASLDFAAKEIVQLLKPLALLAPSIAEYGQYIDNESTAPLQRDVWFNIAVHGITPGTSLWEKHVPELQELAIYTKPLVAEDRTDHLESDIELNTVLRRGVNGPRTVEVKKSLMKLLPGPESHVKSLTYSKVIFIHAAYSLETLRAISGSCADVLTYFTDPSINQEDTANCMIAVANEVLAIYLKNIMKGFRPNSIATTVSKELARVLVVCCHRIPKCQEVAMTFADRLISRIPSSLCQRSSLFALLELLTLMWLSCLDAEIQEYDAKSNYISALGNVSLELSDDFSFRRKTLNRFHNHAKSWLMKVLNIAPLDAKGLLQTYLSEYDDDGAYGHVSLGRSFALEIGSAIPMTDHKLDAINRQDESNINTGSDFIAQYTTRQEYKYAEALPEYDREWQNLIQIADRREEAMNKFDQDVRDVEAILAVLERRVLEGKFIAIGELRDILRRAAALLCRSRRDQCGIIRQLVRIPFNLLTKQSIKLGISIWLGVINENPRMETRILIEIVHCWEESVRKHKGVFDEKLICLDPFYIKEEFAPTDKPALVKRQQAVHSLISPHLRVLQFLTSHFNAFRLGSPHLRRSVHRLVSITLRGLQSSSCHPLLREFHFEIILFGLAVLKLSDDLGKAARWRLKDRILSAALAWFAHPPRWTFGGNRLQVKAECDLMSDVENAVKQVTDIGVSGTDTLASLSIKQDLLLRLLEHERSRLQVWLFPLDHAGKSVARADKATLSSLSPSSLIAAWNENPNLAIQVALRSQSTPLLNEIRNLVLREPAKALEDPDALHILLDEGLPGDVSTQLRYLLYWVPVNPITAVTYFLPSYGNHPFIIQYAMRALESHSIDVTFFYVPQIVQTLRYDALGYVERYIIETAKFSQLFAHQIIWNMKANAYKDEDSTVEDPLKPTLDKVMDHMIASYSTTDKDFYEREFSFFGEVTGISGKLRPYIKKEKSEKKQKIEEELRKINVEVGVYLPSNPDGVVVGIDRKSGKPLQSHAKAPFMATFRIRKNRGDMEGTDNLLEDVNQQHEASANTDPRSNASAVATENTYEVWQSAIFKVGDDCRQDMLALQLIAAFRGIFNSVGLDVYVFPYRVTATAPGCGVIDVLPNSISRDMLGREAVNGLYEYFVSKYGGEASIRFQAARQNFVKSMAAYSVISYLLQFKDRHNGNIMVDDAGHILHIDFGFCFDIAPGGVRFERAPFKLTGEMVSVMGGSTSAQSFRWFEELCVKAFLASRPYTEKLCHMVRLMLDSGLPCFKPETIAHFRQRMVLEKSEREAAEFMQDLVRKSYGSYSTKGYDHFQLLTNGIPY